MKVAYVTIAAMFIGTGIGGFTVQTLHAQSKAPVYYIGQVEVTDQTGYQRDFVQQSSVQVQAGGGRFLVRGGKVTTLAGAAPPSRIIIQQWESLEAMNKWFNSDEQKKLREIQAKYAKVQAFAVEGVPQQ